MCGYSKHITKHCKILVLLIFSRMLLHTEGRFCDGCLDVCGLLRFRFENQCLELMSVQEHVDATYELMLLIDVKRIK